LVLAGPKMLARRFIAISSHRQGKRCWRVSDRACNSGPLPRPAIHRTVVNECPLIGCPCVRRTLLVTCRCPVGDRSSELRRLGIAVVWLQGDIVAVSSRPSRVSR
jgi:hypothetical protein